MATALFMCSITYFSVIAYLVSVEYAVNQIYECVNCHVCQLPGALVTRSKDYNLDLTLIDLG